MLYTATILLDDVKKALKQASEYGTTYLATIIERTELYNPYEIIYIVDKRQELHEKDSKDYRKVFPA